MVFEFANKVVLPRAKKRTVASVVDLFMIECLSKFLLISLFTLMIEHMYKVVHVKEGKHWMPYGYFINKVFKYFGVIYEKETPGNAKKVFSLVALIENECVKGKLGTMSQMSELIAI